MEKWLIDYDDEKYPSEFHGTLDEAKAKALSEFESHTSICIRYQYDGLERCRYIDNKWIDNG